MDYPLFFPNYVPASLYIEKPRTPQYIKAAVTDIQDAKRNIWTLDKDLFIYRTLDKDHPDPVWMKIVKTTPKLFRPFKYNPSEWRPRLETILEDAVKKDLPEARVTPSRRSSSNTGFLSRLRSLFFSCWGCDHH